MKAGWSPCGPAGALCANQAWVDLSENGGLHGWGIVGIIHSSMENQA